MIFNFINFLRKNSIDYCFTNGYEDIFNNEQPNGDNDILLRKVDFLSVDDHIKAFVREHNYEIVQCFHQGKLAKNYFIYNPVTAELLNLDIYGELSRLNIFFESENEIFESRALFKDIFILAPETEFIYYLIKKMDKNQLSSQCFQYLADLFNKNDKSCRIIAKKYLPKNHHLVIEFFENKTFDMLMLSRVDILNEFTNSNKKKPKNIFSNALRVAKRIIQPTGLVICFLGPDGSGKSTIINEVKKSNLPFRRVDYFHLKPIKQTDLQAASVVLNPHEFKVYSKLKSFIKLCYFLVIYNSGYLKNIIPLQIKSSLVIFDRYFDDLLVDNKRYRYGGGIKIAKAFKWFIPSPDITFVLTAEPSIIYSRKKEVNFEELERQVSGYRKLGLKRGFCNIDVNEAPAEIALKVNEKIMEKMNERF